VRKSVTNTIILSAIILIFSSAIAFSTTGDAFLSKGSSEVFITADGLLKLIDDNRDGVAYGAGDDLSNDPLIISVRKKEHYEAGHIPGAINIATFTGMAKAENLAKLDEALNAHKAKTGNDQIVVYCYTGHGAGLTTGVLGALGYNVKNMKFGMCYGWNNDAAIGCGKPTPTPINAFVEAVKPPVEKPPVTPAPTPTPTPAPKEGVCGPTAVVAIAMLPLVLYGVRKRWK